MRERMRERGAFSCHTEGFVYSTGVGVYDAAVAEGWEGEEAGAVCNGGGPPWPTIYIA
jgi:hypothetical protein